MALKHPKFFPFFAVHRLNTRAGVAFINGVIGILREAGFSDRDAARYFREIGYYLTGAALDETAGYAKGPSAAEPVSDATIAADFKHLAAAAPYFQPGHFPGDVRDRPGNPAGGDPAGPRGLGTVKHLLNGREGHVIHFV